MVVPVFKRGSLFFISSSFSMTSPASTLRGTKLRLVRVTLALAAVLAGYVHDYVLPAPSPKSQCALGGAALLHFTALSGMMEGGMLNAREFVQGSHSYCSNLAKS